MGLVGKFWRVWWGNFKGAGRENLEGVGRSRSHQGDFSEKAPGIFRDNVVKREWMDQGTT